MILSLSWLKEILPHQKTDKQIIDALLQLGIEPEAIDKDYLNLEITPNRGDLLSVLGIAHDLNALWSKKIKEPSHKTPTKELDIPLEVAITDKKLCLRYSYYIITNLKNNPTPPKIKARLEKAGIRSLGAIIDITNYVMLELGQPLHAFDYQKLSSPKMIIRQAKNNEKLMTLDGKIRGLDENTMVIENDGKIIDLVGIMGGENSGVSEKTKTIILQAAIFDPTLIRLTSKKQKLVTEASYRYERGVDFQGTIKALQRATHLILKSCGGEASPIFDIITERPTKPTIEFEPAKINQFLGTSISQKKMIDILERLSFKIIKKEKLAAIPPSYRTHINDWPDLAEEIARVYGYNKIPSHRLSFIPPKILENDFYFEEKLTDLWIDKGFNQTKSYSFCSEKDLDVFKIKKTDLVEVKNPVSQEWRFLRPNLLITILKQIAKNPWTPEIKVFEIGAVFKPNEEREICLVVDKKNKNTLEKELEGLLGKRPLILPVDNQILAQLKIRKTLWSYSFPIRLVSFKDKEFFVPKKVFRIKPISEFPPAVFDLAFVLDRKTSPHSVSKAIKEIDEKIILVELFDEYISDRLGANQKNLAFHVWAQDMEKTLTDLEAETIRQKIIQTIEKKFKARLRAF